MKLAVISTHGIHRAKIGPLNGEHEDSTSFMQWLPILDGTHFCFKQMTEEDMQWLTDFDVVMMSGHLRHIADIIRIAKFLKGSNTLSMFYPEGSAQLYDNSIRGFHKEYYQAWASCDIVSICEEDKVSYYEQFVPKETLVRFVHVPITEDMEQGKFFIPRERKQNSVVVYGDNNPNHPMIAAACARNIGATIWMVECGDDSTIGDIKQILDYDSIWGFGKQTQNQFLRNLGTSLVHFYPTEWIGTARQVISCAVVGTPCIGNHDSHTQKRLFPELACDIYDTEKMTVLAKALILDNNFYNRIQNEALKALKFYNLDSTRNRFVMAINDSKARKREKISV